MPGKRGIVSGELPQQLLQTLASGYQSCESSITDVDTGLTYQGQSVSPTWVGITPTGYQVTGTVGIFPHQADTLIDIQVNDGIPWTGLAVYVL